MIKPNILNEKTIKYLGLKVPPYFKNKCNHLELKSNVRL